MCVEQLNLEVACSSERGQVVWQLSLLLRPLRVAAAALKSLYSGMGNNGEIILCSIAILK